MYKKWLAVFGLLLPLVGCQQWQADPLNLERYATQWNIRQIDCKPVRQFANQLNDADTNGVVPFNLEDGITLQEAEAIALWYNPDLRLIRQEARIPLATAENAGLWEDPELALEIMAITSRGQRGGYRVRGPSLEGITLSQPEIRPAGIYKDEGNWVDKPFTFGAGLNITLPVSGRLLVEKDLAWANLDSSLQIVAIREWQVDTRFCNAWYEWSSLLKHAELLQWYIDNLNDILLTADTLAESGELKPTDARIFRIECATRKVELVRLRSQERLARIRILGMMGLEPDSEIQLIPSIRTRSIDVSEEQQARAIIDNHPQIVQAMKAYEKAEQDLRYQIQCQYPDLTVGPGYAYDDGLPRFGLSFGFSLPLWNANRQAIAEARAARDAARVRAETEYETVMNQLSNARIRLAIASESRSLLIEEVAPMVDRQVEETRKLISLGEADVLLLEEAVMRDYSAKVGILEATLELAIASEELHSMLEPIKIKTCLPGKKDSLQ